MVDLPEPVMASSTSMNGAGQTNPGQKKDKKGRKEGRGKAKRRKGTGEQN